MYNHCLIGSHSTAREGSTARLAASVGERPIAYWPILARLTGSVAAGLLLSQLVYWQQTVRREFYKTDAELEQETGLGSKALRTAKKRLEGLPGVGIERKRWPARTFYHIDESAILAHLSSLPISAEQKHSLADSAEQDLPKGRNRSDRNGGTIEHRLPTDYAQTTDSLSKDAGGSVQGSRKKTPKRRSPREFTPPTREDVRQWIKAHPKYADVDPDRFFDHYAVADWIDSQGKPVQCWQQRIISWSNPNGKRQSQSGHRATAASTGHGRRNQNTREPLPTADGDPDAIEM